MRLLSKLILALSIFLSISECYAMRSGRAALPNLTRGMGLPSGAWGNLSTMPLGWASSRRCISEDLIKNPSEFVHKTGGLTTEEVRAAVSASSKELYENLNTKTNISSVDRRTALGPRSAEAPCVDKKPNVRTPHWGIKTHWSPGSMRPVYELNLMVSAGEGKLSAHIDGLFDSSIRITSEMAKELAIYAGLRKLLGDRNFDKLAVAHYDEPAKLTGAEFSIAGLPGTPKLMDLFIRHEARRPMPGEFGRVDNIAIMDDIDPLSPYDSVHFALMNEGEERVFGAYLPGCSSVFSQNDLLRKMLDNTLAWPGHKRHKEFGENKGGKQTDAAFEAHKALSSLLSDKLSTPERVSRYALLLMVRNEGVPVQYIDARLINWFYRLISEGKSVGIAVKLLESEVRHTGWPKY